MDLCLKDKVVLLSGATKGICRVIAELLADEGCHIGLCARNSEEVNSTVKALSAKGVKVHGGALDVADEKAYRKWISECAEALGGIDIFIPGVSAGGLDTGESGWKANFELDLMGAVRGIDAALPHLEKSTSGSILIISTTAAVENFVGPTPYAAIKTALLNYAGNLALQLAPKGIRVNAMTLGPIFVEGGIWDQIKQGMPEIYEATVGRIPMGRMGSGDEVAVQAALLVSPRSSFTTGTNVVIDGGLTQRIQY